MKKIFEYLGLLSLICFSFFITEKTATVVQEVDELMIQIKNEMNNYNVEGMDAKIKDDTIIPGLVNKNVNVSKSYQNMKEKGLYNESFYIYDEVLPQISVSNNMDKYIISGNLNKNMVSLVFLIENKSINDIQNIIGTTPVSYVIENYNIDAQLEFITNTTKLNNDIIISSSDKETYRLLKNKLVSLNIDLNYCYNENKNNDFLNMCSSDKNYSIYIDSVIDNKPLITVKKELKAGSILVFKINDEVIKELPNIISYIESRGYVIEHLSKHLSENW